MATTVEKARAEFAAGKHSRALRHTWDLVMVGVNAKDAAALGVARDLAAEMSRGLSGKDQEQADQLVRFAEACIDSLERGEEQGSWWQRLLFGRTTKETFRKCPDCAESIKSAAKVCRYCGHRFEPTPRPSA